MDEDDVDELERLGLNVDDEHLERVKKLSASAATNARVRSKAEEALAAHTISTVAAHKNPFTEASNLGTVKGLEGAGGELGGKATAALNSYSINKLKALGDKADTAHMDRVASVLKTPGSPDREAAHNTMLSLPPKNKYRKGYEKELQDGTSNI